jgi:hypothetical protein
VGIDQMSEALQRLGVAPSMKLMLAYARLPGANFILFVWAMLAFMHAFIIDSGFDDFMWEYRMDVERSIPEFWEFLMLLASSALLAFQSIRLRLYSYLIPSLMLLYMAVDGRMELHETLGPALWPEHRHAGEFFFMVGAGSAFLLALAYVISRSSSFQKVELTCFAVLLVIFGLFGVVMDGLHMLLLQFTAYSDQPMAWLEDGGELLIISLMLILTLGAFKRLGAT